MDHQKAQLSRKTQAQLDDFFHKLMAQGRWMQAQVDAAKQTLVITDVPSSSVEVSPCM